MKNQIEGMKDFVGDNQMPYDVVDKTGHGTHVAGSIAAQEAADGFVGVAPKASLLIGRVCNEEGCSSVSIVRGINWGIEQKVDVINMSLGGDVGSQAQLNAVNKAEKAGVVIVAAAGNEGTAVVGFPAAFHPVIAVGAIDVNKEKADFSQWGPELDVVAPGVEVFSSVPIGSGCESIAKLTVGSTGSSINSSCFSGSALLAQARKKELVFAGQGKPEDFAGKDLTGKFALVVRGENLFSEKVQNALVANAEGVILYNNIQGLMGGSITEDGSLLAIPVVMIEKAVGDKLKADLASGKKAFIELKTMPTDYSSFSGTSMASPHVAGVVALIRATRKSLSPAQIRDILKTSATPLGPNTQNEYGAGLIDAEKAVTKAVYLR